MFAEKQPISRLCEPLAVGSPAASAAHVASVALSVEACDSIDKLVALRSEWQQLADAHGEGLPFRTWEWQVAWWTHFSLHQKWIQDSLFVRTFRAPSGRLVGIAPLILTERPFGLRVVDFFGADPNITELRGILCDPQWAKAVHESMRRWLADSKGDWDLMNWRGLREEATGLSEIQIWKEVPNYILALPSSWQEFKSTRGRNVKESLRKCYNSLKRDGHSLAMAVAVTPSEIADGVQRFLRLHEARAGMAGATPHPNVFCTEAAQRFLAEVAQRLAERRMARVFQLLVNGEVVAARVGFALGQSLYLYYSGFDPRWAEYSVATTLVAEILQHAIHEGFRSVNLSTGTDVSKTRWGPDKISYFDALQVGSPWRGWLAYHAYRSGPRSARLMALARSVVGRKR